MSQTLSELANVILLSLEEEDKNIEMRTFGYKMSGKASEFQSAKKK